MSVASYLHISVENLAVMQGLETADNLYENVPYLLFFDVGLALLVATYLLEHVSVVCILHYQTAYDNKCEK